MSSGGEKPPGTGREAEWGGGGGSHRWGGLGRGRRLDPAVTPDPKPCPHIMQPQFAAAHSNLHLLFGAGGGKSEQLYWAACSLLWGKAMFSPCPTLSCFCLPLGLRYSTGRLVCQLQPKLALGCESVTHTQFLLFCGDSISSPRSSPGKPMCA